jgi:hypothetical protein
LRPDRHDHPDCLSCNCSVFAQFNALAF